jgi:RNA polymerase sigma-70 factor (ECF subfamily)
LASRKAETPERLLVEAAQRDSTRFAELYELNFSRVYAYIVRRVGNREDAQDLTAEVFLQALASLGKFEWRGVPFAVWLFKLAANAIADRWKRAARETGNPSSDVAQEISAPEQPDLEEIERRAQLFNLVKRLPQDQRRVIELRFAEEKSIREISQALGRTEGSIKQLQFRALETLRQRMGKANG